MKAHFLVSALILTVLAAGTAAQEAPVAEVVPRSEVAFQPLNPLRGDASPKAGLLWGDIGEDTPTGAIIQFRKGFSSPPHIHNITYRAVVIDGLVHNDDPKALPQWMGPGSFWVQPAGEPHITAASEDGPATAFLEILQGPYLVQPSEEAFDDGERPVNIDASNLVWLTPSDTSWIGEPATADDTAMPSIAYLWGSPKDDQMHGTFLRMPSGYRGALSGSDAWLRAVVIKGELRHQLPGSSDAKTLESGSYFGSRGETHEISCGATETCLLYVRTEGPYQLEAL